MRCVKAIVACTLVLTSLAGVSGCGAASSLVSSLLEQCQDFSNNELDIDLNEECRELEDFLGSNQDNLPAVTQIFSVRETGDNSDIAFMITDSSGNPVTGLADDDITVSVSNDSGSTYAEVANKTVDSYEELATSEPGSGHISFSTIIDNSGSITDDDLDYVTSALVYLYENMIDIYRSEVVRFSTDVTVAQSYTSDKDALLAAVRDETSTRAYTSMYDAMLQAIEDTAQETATLRLGFLFTDGIDNDSENNYDTVKAQFQTDEIPICVIGVSFANVTHLQEIADDSGCFFIYKPLFSSLEEAFQTVVDQVKNFYRIRIDSDDLAGMDYVKIQANVQGEVREAIKSL